MSRVEGGCYCGAVRYKASGAWVTIDIATCSLDEPERFPPTHHSWLAHDLRWVKFGDGLPTYSEFRPRKTGG